MTDFVENYNALQKNRLGSGRDEYVEELEKGRKYTPFWTLYRTSKSISWQFAAVPISDTMRRQRISIYEE